MHCTAAKVFFLVIFCASPVLQGQKITVTTKSSGLFIPQTTYSLTEAKAALVAASGYRGLSCIDPSTGRETGTYVGKNNYLCATSGGGTLVYVLTDMPALLLFDVKNPAKPALTKTLKLPRLFSSLAVCGKFLAIYSPDSPCRIVDMSKTDSPKLLPDDSPVAFQKIFTLKDKFLGISGQSLYLFGPGSVPISGSAFLTNLPLGADGMFIHGEALYFLVGQNRPFRISVTDEKTSISESSYPFETKTAFSCAQNEYVLTKSGTILRQSSGSWVDTGLRTPFLDMNILALADDCWFYHPATDLFRFSFADPAKPVLKSVTKREKMWSCALVDGTTLVTGSAGSINFYEMKKPAKPEIILEAECDEAPLWMFLRENRLVAFCARSARVYSFDGSKTLTLVSAFALDSSPLQAIRLQDHFFLACGKAGLLHFSLSSSGRLELRGVVAEKKCDIRSVAVDGEEIVALDSGYGAFYYGINPSGQLDYKKKVAVPGGIVSAAYADDGKIYINRMFAPPAILQDSELYDAFFPSQIALSFSAKYALYSENGVKKISLRQNQFQNGSDLPDHQISALNADALYLYSRSGLSVLGLK